MGEAQKFLFDECFEEGPPEGTLTLSQVEALKKEAYDEGLANHRASNETQARQVLSLLSEKLVEMEREKLKEITAQSAALVAAILKKAFPVLSSVDPLKEIESFILKTLETFEIQNTCAITVHPDLVSDVQAFIQGAKIDVATTVQGDDTFMLMDCRAQWGEGGVERLQNYIQAQVMEMLSRLCGRDLSQMQVLSEQADVSDALSSDNQKDQVTDSILPDILEENNNESLENSGATEEAK